MHIQYDDEMKKRIMVYATSLIIAIVIGLIVFNMGQFSKALRTFLNTALPFLIGFGLAVILRIPVSIVETKLLYKFKRKRLFSALTVFALFILLLVLLILLIVPNIIQSMQQFLSNNNEYTNNLITYIELIQKNLGIEISAADTLFDSQNLSTSLSQHVSLIANYSIAAVRFLINFILSLVSAFYMILDQEQLTKTIKKMNYGLFSMHIARTLSMFVLNAKDIFDKFIVGSIIDSSIISVLCFIGVSILKIPYSPMIAFIIGITNMIPVFGPFIGAIPVAFLLVLVKPIYALLFIIFILALQQFDGNILKPVVLGDQLGLSGFWILFSVTVGGGLAGIPGMFLGVPIFALIYRTAEDFMEARLKEKKIDINEEV